MFSTPNVNSSSYSRIHAGALTLDMMIPISYSYNCKAYSIRLYAKQVTMVLGQPSICCMTSPGLTIACFFESNSSDFLTPGIIPFALQLIKKRISSRFLIFLDFVLIREAFTLNFIDITNDHKCLWINDRDKMVQHSILFFIYNHHDHWLFCIGIGTMRM